MTNAYGTLAPGWLDRGVIAVTSRLPNNWLGLRIAIGLRRIVTRRILNDGGLDVTRWGLRLRLHPRRNGCEKGLLFTPQMFEVPERRALLAEIERAKAAAHTFVFIDIGANVGLFSFWVAAQNSLNSKILAIEPEPENLERLRFNIAANPGVPIEVVPVALGAAAGNVALDVNRRDKGGTRTRPPSSDQANVLLVECWPLLDVLRKESVSYIDALKIDVEGDEDKILIPFFRHAEKSLWPTLIIIEDGRDLWGSDLFSVLEKIGYTILVRTKLNVILRRPQKLMPLCVRSRPPKIKQPERGDGPGIAQPEPSHG